MRAEMRKLPTDMTELEYFIGEMKNPLEGITSKVTAAKERISELKDKVHNKFKSRGRNSISKPKK